MVSKVMCGYCNYNENEINEITHRGNEIYFTAYFNDKNISTVISIIVSIIDKDNKGLEDVGFYKITSPPTITIFIDSPGGVVF